MPVWTQGAWRLVTRPHCALPPGALLRWHLLRMPWERVRQAARHAMGRRVLGGMLAAAVWLLGQPGFPGAQMSQPGEPPAQLEPVVVTPDFDSSKYI